MLFSLWLLTSPFPLPLHCNSREEEKERVIEFWKGSLDSAPDLIGENLYAINIQFWIHITSIQGDLKHCWIVDSAHYINNDVSGNEARQINQLNCCSNQEQFLVRKIRKNFLSPHEKKNTLILFQVVPPKEEWGGDALFHSCHAVLSGEIVSFWPALFTL